VADLDRLTRLFQAIAARDWKAAEDQARQVAAAEERIGHHVAAQRLRGALHHNGSSSGADSTAAAPHVAESSQSGYFLTSALMPVSAERGLGELRLQRAARNTLEEVVEEWQRHEELAAHHIERRTKLLFHGPPGCGKSISARALGRELKLPVYVVRFDAIVGAYLGQTALHLRQVFRFVETTACVLLIDEIDALGKRRGNPLDVGELDRVVIALLQELEHSRPAGLLIATSNIGGQLDDALWRRFDLVLKFPSPSRADLHAFASQRANARQVPLTKQIRKLLARAKSYADAERMIDAGERRRILHGR
jgi:SpoVK/Ycf46/Vps4 family AAA+-type ATPase